MWKSQLQLLSATRQKTLALVDSLSQSELDRRPAAGKWSIGEVLDHVLLAEKLYRSEISELIDLQKSGKRPRIRRNSRQLDVTLFFLPKAMLPLVEVPLTIFNFMVPSTLREWMTQFPIVPAVNPTQAEPREGRSGEVLRRELQESVRETEALFASNADLDYSKMVHEHPMLGVNNVLKLVRITARHEQRHHSQIKRLLKGLS
jgi:uncharacterized damage-inducible protein DinB